MRDESCDVVRAFRVQGSGFRMSSRMLRFLLFYMETVATTLTPSKAVSGVVSGGSNKQR